ncbi:hypothetical protein AB0O76_06270 [Streptomyces sp. NPDC086554]|uniref:hypothetical protein n=1 Tax=Streptomyces sp. NPDC086554 TaxID=3154864 RepID=UPI00342A434D
MRGRGRRRRPPTGSGGGALLTTENPDGTANLAPISSAWALGHTVVIGLGAEGHTAANLADRPELVVNLPSPRPLGGGGAPRPAHRRGPGTGRQARGLPPRAGQVRRGRAAPAGPDSGFRIMECEVVRVHAAPSFGLGGAELGHGFRSQTA